MWNEKILQDLVSALIKGLHEQLEITVHPFLKENVKRLYVEHPHWRSDKVYLNITRDSHKPLLYVQCEDPAKAKNYRGRFEKMETVAQMIWDKVMHPIPDDLETNKEVLEALKSTDTADTVDQGVDLPYWSE